MYWNNRNGLGFPKKREENTKKVSKNHRFKIKFKYNSNYDRIGMRLKSIIACKCYALR